MAKSLEGQFADWVREQPAELGYEYFSNKGCAIFLFLKAAQYPVESVGGVSWTDKKGARHELPFEMYRAASTDPFTYGALADRLAS